MSNQNAMSGEEMQNKIATARRDAEGLKDRIKRRKDELADATRTFPHFHQLVGATDPPAVFQPSSSLH